MSLTHLFSLPNAEKGQTKREKKADIRAATRKGEQRQHRRSRDPNTHTCDDIMSSQHRITIPSIHHSHYTSPLHNRITGYYTLQRYHRQKGKNKKFHKKDFCYKRGREGRFSS